ncbi:MAG: DUF2065 domain-containing protein [Euryhalocaulis sp.]|nr:DUF2065 domain-containing protein [Euryhalocaulis sp.]
MVFGLGFALALEGAAYALFPGPMTRMIRDIAESPAERLRIAGIVALAAGIGIIWLARHEMVLEVFR